MHINFGVIGFNGCACDWPCSFETSHKTGKTFKGKHKLRSRELIGSPQLCLVQDLKDQTHPVQPYKTFL